MIVFCCCSCRSVVVDFCPDLHCSSGFDLFLAAEKDLQVSLESLIVCHKVIFNDEISSLFIEI